jgi:hypothetical protein
MENSKATGTKPETDEVKAKTTALDCFETSDFSEYQEVNWATSYSDGETAVSVSVKSQGHMVNLIRDLNRAFQVNVMAEAGDKR